MNQVSITMSQKAPATSVMSSDSTRMNKPSTSSRKSISRKNGSRHNSSGSPSTSTSSSKRDNNERRLVFTHEEIIPDIPYHSRSPPSLKSVRSTSSRSQIRRSPTPVLTSLTELANAHAHQLSCIWKEQSVPSIETDKRSIAATRGAKDPFDF